MTTSTSDVLERLAERCEKASGPDRELDCLIFEGQHKLLTPDRRGTINGEPTGQYFDLNGDQLPECAPRYTASLDAAMSLVSKNGRLLELGQWQENGKAGQWFAQVTQWHRDGENSWRDQGYAVGLDLSDNGIATGPLALAAACLRAKAALARSQESGR